MHSLLEDLKEIEHSLELLSKDLDAQISVHSLDNDAFHERLINLTSKYPENKELIQFIVTINDKLVTSQVISRDIFYETIKGIIVQKRFLIKRIIKYIELRYQPKESTISKIFEYIKNNKTTLIIIGVSVAFTLLMIGVFVVPSETIETLKLLKGISGK
jgi:TPP-dependent trihydroxycyclohexane-1,2-dione (THcHDO) dehydratase